MMRKSFVKSGASLIMPMKSWLPQFELLNLIQLRITEQYLCALIRSPHVKNQEAATIA